jgi:hypothetical protein
VLTSFHVVPLCFIAVHKFEFELMLILRENEHSGKFLHALMHFILMGWAAIACWVIAINFIY